MIFGKFFCEVILSKSPNACDFKIRKKRVRSFNHHKVMIFGEISREVTLSKPPNACDLKIRKKPRPEPKSPQSDDFW